MRCEGAFPDRQRLGANLDAGRLQRTKCAVFFEGCITLRSVANRLSPTPQTRWLGTFLFEAQVGTVDWRLSSHGWESDFYELEREQYWIASTLDTTRN